MSVLGQGTESGALSIARGEHGGSDNGSHASSDAMDVFTRNLLPA